MIKLLLFGCLLLPLQLCFGQMVNPNPLPPNKAEGEFVGYRNAVFVNFTSTVMGKGRLNYQRSLGTRHAVGVEGIYSVLSARIESDLVDYSTYAFNEITGYGGSVFYKYYYLTFGGEPSLKKLYVSPRGTLRHHDRKDNDFIVDGIIYKDVEEYRDIYSLELRGGLDASRGHLFWGGYLGYGYGTANRHVETTVWGLDGNGDLVPTPTRVEEFSLEDGFINIGFNLGFTF